MDAPALIIALKTPRPFGSIAKRISGGTPQLVATAKGLRSTRWEIDWDRVDRIYIGKMLGTGERTLCLDPIRTEDLRWQPSRFLRFLRWTDSLLNKPAVQFPERLFERPLEDIIADLAAVAGRTLG